MFSLRMCCVKHLHAIVLTTATWVAIMLVYYSCISNW